jgi:hypothetical protein
MFVDQFTQEYSRDIEPMKGGHLDNYYYQLIAGIRRYKGVRRGPAPAPPPARPIVVDGNFEDWRGVGPEYRDDRGDVMHRDHPGYDDAGRYVNRTGRNDLVLMKVAADATHVCFYARTAEPISPAGDPDWMQLYIDADGNPATGRLGYDLAVNRRAGRDTASVETCRDGSRWESAGEAACRVRGTEMELALPRARFGSGGAGLPSFDFKWADNCGEDADAAGFMLNGDTAPNCRFNYRFN